MSKKISINGKSLNEIEKICQDLSFPKFHGEQIYRWMYNKKCLNTSEMHNVPIKLLSKINENYFFENLKIKNKSKSKIDQTTKYLLETNDSNYIESVSMIDNNRHTVCLSSQIGCSVDCDFCATGKMGIIRNLSIGEILEQVIIIQKNSNLPITNIVFMGMGEPFLNYLNTINACKILSDNKAFNFGKKRITISTSGILPKIKKYIEEKHRYKLAISLNAPNNELRDKIIPINKKWNIDDILAALKKYEYNRSTPIMFEYILLKNFNDSDNNAFELSNLLKNTPCKVNLIPFNQTGTTYSRSETLRINNFAKILNENSNNIRVLIRWSKGEDIDAACGQLATNNA